MRNIFLFIRRYFNFLFFLLLQGFSIYLIVHYNRYHNVVASSYMNEVTGRVNAKYDQIQYYLQLKKTNDSLVKANEKLYNKLKIDFNLPDTVSKIVIDSIRVDSLVQFRKYNYLGAKVIYNSFTQQNNYIELGRGAMDSIKKDMGVVDPNNAVVGIITDVSNGYAVVMSLLNKDSRISARLKSNGDVGTVIWDGEDPSQLELTDIRKSVKVAKGDTVFTSGYTTAFPYGLMIGTIDEIIKENGSTNYLIKLKPTANFYGLQYVYAIDNLEKEKINKLLDKVKKQNQ